MRIQVLVRLIPEDPRAVTADIEIELTPADSARLLNDVLRYLPVPSRKLSTREYVLRAFKALGTEPVPSATIMAQMRREGWFSDGRTPCRTIWPILREMEKAGELRKTGVRFGTRWQKVEK